ncbi:cache domain-containing protein [Arcobacter sp. CECT 8985]|uniref:sensor histidine kinase n=1 Tax=Arcobacter sp. CECT 8985 TaxID=1935424 RepID=UPI00100B4BEB|nr:cache domain-containing protein [Arcobacter sp. CECT 8985]RXJ84921.1 histidine kinase [Arcobacter sp. CECT 8985]
MLSKKEKKILTLIKFFPIVIIFITALTTSTLFLTEHEKHYNGQLQNIRNTFIKTQQIKIKNEVDRIYEYISFHKKNSEKKIKEVVKVQVNEAYSILEGLYNNYKDTKTKRQIIKMYKASLRNIRFLKNRGYFYVYDMNGTNIFHGLSSDLEGSFLYYHKDIAGKRVIQNMIEKLKKNSETYDEWYWEKPNSNKVQRKIGYQKLFKPYNIFVGSGEYVEDFENELKDKILEYISNIKYLNNRKITILDRQGNVITTKNSDLVGKNLYKIDKKNSSLYKRILSFKGDQSKYISVNDNTIFNDTKYKKLTLYLRSYSQWKWVILSSFYEETLEHEIETNVNVLKKGDNKVLTNFVLIVTFLCLIMIILSLYVTDFLEKSFFKYQKKIIDEMQMNRDKDNMIAQQSKMASMGEMIGNIAHQWRQPLSAISTAVTGLKFEKEMGILEDDNFIRGMDSIHDSVIYLSKTIDDFRNFFKPNKIKTIFQLKDTIQKTLNILSSQFNMNEIYFVKNIEDVKVFGQENELIQVLINILNNARDELKKIPDDRFIFIDVLKEGNKAKLIIKDSAGGIPPDIIKKVFEPYFTTKPENGTGIGLHMSKQIIEDSLQGTIEVQNNTFEYKNKEYKGAKFTMTFDISN